MHNLIGKYRELEKQELVLSSPRYFNDPLEGHQDVFWDGDEILWENLLRHYISNLHHAAIICAVFDDESFDESAIEPKMTRNSLPTDEWRGELDSVYQTFFEERGFKKIPSRLASLPEPLKRGSLQLILSLIHRPALGTVLKTMRSSGMIPETWPRVESPTDSDTVVKMLDALSAVMTSEIETDLVESMASQFGSLKSQVFLQGALQEGAESLELHRKKAILLFASFPNRYIRNICNSLIHTDWHVLCFARECTSPPMWATYADEHRGAALMFHTDDQSEESWSELDVRARTGWNGSEPKYGEISAPLHTVDYESPPPQVDFFRFLGTLPIPDLISTWHSTPDGETTSVVDEILENESKWRDELWSHFHNMTTTKLSQWKYEQEVRMVLPDLLGSEGPRKKVTYDLSQLAGVVFGLRTSLEDRYEVMRILSERSQDSDSTSVEFYQMVFDGTSFRKVRIGV